MDTSKILTELGRKLEEEAEKVRVPATWVDLSKLVAGYSEDQIEYSNNPEIIDFIKESTANIKKYESNGCSIK